MQAVIAGSSQKFRAWMSRMYLLVLFPPLPPPPPPPSSSLFGFDSRSTAYHGSIGTRGCESHLRETHGPCVTAASRSGPIDVLEGIIETLS
jgi:hypothetical protein